MLDLADYDSVWSHTSAWGLYIVAAMIFLLSYLQLTRRWWFELRWLVFVLLAVFLLVPAPVPNRPLLAPAMIFVVLEPFTGTPEMVAAVLVRLIVVAAAAIVFLIFISAFRRWRRHRRKPSPT